MKKFLTILFLSVTSLLFISADVFHSPAPHATNNIAPAIAKAAKKATSKRYKKHCKSTYSSCRYRASDYWKGKCSKRRSPVHSGESKLVTP